MQGQSVTPEGMLLPVERDELTLTNRKTSELWEANTIST